MQTYKFRIQYQLDLLGYTVDDVIGLIYLEVVCPYENFYFDLKRFWLNLRGGHPAQRNVKKSQPDEGWDF